MQIDSGSRERLGDLPLAEVTITVDPRGRLVLSDRLWMPSQTLQHRAFTPLLATQDFAVERFEGVVFRPAI